MPADVPGRSPEPGSSQPPLPPSEKGALEIEKLKLEIRELSRSSWIKPTVIIPIVATLSTLAYSQYLGVFQLARERIAFEQQKNDAAKADLETRTKALQNEKLALEQGNAVLKGRTEKLAAQESTLHSDIEALDTRKSVLDREIGDLQLQVRTLSSPQLTIGFELVPQRQLAGILVRNAGRGPAKILATWPFVDGEAIGSGRIGKEFSPTMAALGIDEPWVEFEYRGSLAAGDTFSMLNVVKEQFDSTTEARFNSVIRRLSLAICYCAVDGSNCRWALYNKPSTTALSCRSGEAR